jgi:beta-galactosidase
LKKPADFTVWRATIDNDRNRRPEWERAHLHHAALNVYSCEAEASENEAVITVVGNMGAPSRIPLYDLKVTYKVSANGLDVSVEGKSARNEVNGHPLWEPGMPGQNKGIYLPRFGIRYAFDDSFEDLEYFGKGPYESYVDISSHTKYGLYNSKVSDQYEPYIRPQECGNHYGTTDILLSEENGASVKITAQKAVEFSALHYSIEQLDKIQHRHELNREDATHLIINYKVGGIGSNSCGPEPLAQHRFENKEIGFSYRISLK